MWCSPHSSTLSSCSHAVVALLYPFSWQHTFIPVLPSSMIDIVCCPTPFLVGLLSSSLPKLKELPVEEVGPGTRIVCLEYSWPHPGEGLPFTCLIFNLPLCFFLHNSPGQLPLGKTAVIGLVFSIVRPSSHTWHLDREK